MIMATLIPVRTNMHLWLLTGRSNDFTNQALNSSVRYDTSAPPAEVTALRQLLRLDYKNSDFYVIGAYLASLMVAGSRLPHAPNTLFASGVLTPLPFYSQGGSLLPMGGSELPGIDGARAGLDGFTAVTVTRSSDTGARITTDNGRTVYDVFSMVGNAVFVSALEQFGIRALLLPDSWVINASMTVVVPQTQYPYELFAGKLYDNNDAVALTSQTGFIDAFASGSAAHKVGAVAQAIMHRMWDVSRNAQVEIVADFERFAVSEPVASDYQLQAGVLADNAVCETV